MNRDEIVSALVRSCPSFVAYWAEVEATYAPVTLNTVPLPEFLPEFARHVLELLQDGRQHLLPAVADAIESLYMDGDAAARSVATTLLELIDSDCQRNGVDPRAFFRNLPNCSRPSGQ